MEHFDSGIHNWLHSVLGQHIASPSVATHDNTNDRIPTLPMLIDVGGACSVLRLYIIGTYFPAFWAFGRPFVLQYLRV